MLPKLIIVSDILSIPTVQGTASVYRESAPFLQLVNVPLFITLLDGFLYIVQHIRM